MKVIEYFEQVYKDFEAKDQYYIACWSGTIITHRMLIFKWKFPAI